LTATVRGALGPSGWDEETAPVSGTKKRHEVGSAAWPDKVRTFLPTQNSEEAFISYEQVLWGQMAAATIVSALPQLALSLMVQKYIVRGFTMGAVR
jgi:ABC-type glycerol-3-phosphate transport system permease component